MGKIVMVGSLIVDITAYAGHFPVEGETVLGDSLRLGPGGKGNNQLTAAHRSGAETVMVSAVGGDFLKEIMLSHYKNEGMSTRFIKEHKDCDTGAAVIEVLRSGENRIIVIKGANDRISAADVCEAEKDFADCDVFVTQNETSTESLAEGIRLAKKYGKTVIYNPAPPQPVDDELFSDIDYFTPNETEAEYYTGVAVKDEADAAYAAKILLKKGVKNVIITLGKHGVYFKNSEKGMLVPTTDLKPVDTTGAGDAFNGGFAAALSENADVETAIKFANCVASIAVTRKGTAPAMPTRGEALELLKSYYGITL